MNIGNKITEYRKNKKWTQKDLAEKLFVTDKAISSWESSRTTPDLESILKLSELFECPVSDLLYDTNEKINLETEIKIKITKDDYIRLDNYLSESAKRMSDSNQIDTYYQPTYRKFLKEDDSNVTEWLRIGLRGNKKILNYKNWYDNKYCDEYEVEIDDEKNLDKIFKKLGLVQIAVVNKKRITYLYKEKYEIALDFVEDLGYFVEIEVKKYNTNALEEYEQLLRLAKSLNLNLNNIDKRGYPYHMIYNNKNLEK